MEKTSDNQLFIMLTAMAASATMIAQHIAGKASRDALFLTYFDVTSLPAMMIISAAVSVVTVLLMSRLLARFGPTRLIPVIFAGSAGLLVLQWMLIDSQPKIASSMLYLQVSAINSVLISGFWSVINERFDPFSAKTVIARIAAAATFGGLMGGVLATAVASMADTRAILLMLALMHAACCLAVYFIGLGATASGSGDDAPVSLLTPLRRSALIRRMAVLALLVATTAAMLDYVLKAEAAAALTPEELISFFSYFYVGIGLFGFLMQSTIGDKALKWFGLGGAMIIWPLVILTTGLATLVFRSLITATLLRGGANIFYNSFFRTGFELMYTPIPAEDKRTGKVLIDVGADRSGDMLGGLIVMGILLLPAYSETLLLLVALVLAIVVAFVILVLQHNYVGQLADNLRKDAAPGATPEPPPSSSSHTLAPVQEALRRDDLLRQVDQHRKLVAVAGAEDAPLPFAPADAAIDAIDALRGDDDDRIRRVLMSRPLTADLVPHVVALLQAQPPMPEALQALKGVADRSTGQLLDALLDPYQPEAVRRRLPLVLAYSESPITVPGLVAALDDPAWNVRFRCARALHMIKRRNPLAGVPEEHLLRLATTEIDAIEKGRSAGQATPAQRLEMTFYLIGAADDPVTVDLCWRAVNGTDRRLKGTAYEYLENRLPPELWNELYAILSSDTLEFDRAAGSTEAAAEALHAAAGELRRGESPESPDSLAAVLEERKSGRKASDGPRHGGGS